VLSLPPIWRRSWVRYPNHAEVSTVILVGAEPAPRSGVIGRYVQSVLDHPGQQLCDVVLFDDERRAKPLRIILDMYEEVHGALHA
jgi:hypothetical protein